MQFLACGFSFKSLLPLSPLLPHFPPPAEQWSRFEPNNKKTLVCLHQKPAIGISQHGYNSNKGENKLRTGSRIYTGLWIACVVTTKEAERIYKMFQNPKVSIGSFNIYHMDIISSIRMGYLTKYKKTQMK